MIHRIFTLFFPLFLLSTSSACLKSEKPPSTPLKNKRSEEQEKKRNAYLKKQNLWADSVLKTMSEDEKIGQLFMIAGYSNQGTAHLKATANLIKKHHIGGIIMMQGSPVRQAQQVNHYQSISRIPLLVAADAEWGLAMRLDSTTRYPRAMVLGAIQNHKTVYDFGKEVARQCKRLGVHINFAPVADINSNPKNPVIGTRSFGEIKENVAQKASAYARGMQDHHVIANAKHFPGHGDTDKDSHYTLPFLGHDLKRLHNVELYPFKKLIQDGIMSVMIAHLNVPALDSSGKPTSLSPKVVQNLLTDSLKYHGLIFTDGLGMKGIANHHQPGDAEVKAILAGNDILLIPMSVYKGKIAIKKAIKSGKLSWERINKSVLKILKAKYFVGLHQYQPIQTKNLYQDLNNDQAQRMKTRIFKEAVTVLKNENHLLPLKNTHQIKFGSIAIGGKKNNVFQKKLSEYAEFEHLIIPKKSYEYSHNRAMNKMANKDIVVVSLHGIHVNSRKNAFGISWATRNFIKKLQAKSKVIIVPFGNPYAMKYFEYADALICGYDNDPMMQKIIPQVLFGAIQANGKLPISASQKFPAGTGIQISKQK